MNHIPARRSALRQAAACVLAASTLSSLPALAAEPAVLRVSAIPDEAPTELQRKFERSEEHTSELQSPCNLVCRLLLEKKNQHESFVLQASACLCLRRR